MVASRWMARFARWHIWLGWLIAVPLLLWMLSGIAMVARPIEEVRGEALVAPAPPMALPAALLPPRVGARPLAKVEIGRRAGAPVWALSFRDGGAATASLATGALLPPPTRAEAVAAARDLEQPGSHHLHRLRHRGPRQPGRDLHKLPRAHGLLGLDLGRHHPGRTLDLP